MHDTWEEDFAEDRRECSNVFWEIPGVSLTVHCHGGRPVMFVRREAPTPSSWLQSPSPRRDAPAPRGYTRNLAVCNSVL